MYFYFVECIQGEAIMRDTATHMREAIVSSTNNNNVTLLTPQLQNSVCLPRDVIFFSIDNGNTPLPSVALERLLRIRSIEYVALSFSTVAQQNAFSAKWAAARDALVLEMKQQQEKEQQEQQQQLNEKDDDQQQQQEEETPESKHRNQRGRKQKKKKTPEDLHSDDFARLFVESLLLDDDDNNNNNRNESLVTACHRIWKLTEFCLKNYNLASWFKSTSSSSENLPLLFRCTGNRLAKTLSFIHMVLAKQFGEFLSDAYDAAKMVEATKSLESQEPPIREFAASMRFNAVDFRIVADENSCVAGIVAHAANAPTAPEQIDADVPVHRITSQRERERRVASVQLAELKKAAAAEDTTNNDNNTGAAAAATNSAAFQETVQFSASRQPSHFRNDFRSARDTGCAMHVGLAAYLVENAKITSGDIMIDPFGGCGTVLIEAMVRSLWNSNSSTALPPPLACFGGDIDHANCQSMQKNFNRDFLLEGVTSVINFHNEVISPSYDSSSSHQPQIAKSLANLIHQRSTVVNWDATRLPLRTNSIDVIVSDAPFGQRCKITKKMMVPCLREFHRVLAPGGRCILLFLERQTLNDCLQEAAESSRRRERKAQQKSHQNDDDDDDDDQQVQDEDETPPPQARPIFEKVVPEQMICMSGLWPWLFIMKRID